MAADGGDTDGEEQQGVRIWSWLVFAAMVALAAACGGAASPAGGSVLVFAAASLTDAFADVETAFEAANPDLDVRVNFGGSSSLREQILAGAPADVFASADPSNVEAVAAAGDTVGEPVVFAYNSLAIAVPRGNPGRVLDLAAFGEDDLLIGVCSEGVPCGDAARRAFGLAGVEPSIDTNEPDVRALLTKIGADELDAGIVYVTDIVAAADGVEGIDIPEAHNVRLTYPIVRIRASSNPGGGARFVEFLTSDEGRSILAGHGFEAP